MKTNIFKQNIQEQVLNNTCNNNLINFKIHDDNFYENNTLIKYLMMHENDK